jgi:hypothetical protein
MRAIVAEWSGRRRGAAARLSRRATTRKVGERPDAARLAAVDPYGRSAIGSVTKTIVATVCCSSSRRGSWASTTRSNVGCRASFRTGRRSRFGCCWTTRAASTTTATIRHSSLRATASGYAAGQMVSTVPDLSAFFAALVKGRLSDGALAAPAAANGDRDASRAGPARGHNRCNFPGHQPDGGLADAAPGARDDRDFAVETSHRLNPSVATRG